MLAALWQVDHVLSVAARRRRTWGGGRAAGRVAGAMILAVALSGAPASAAEVTPKSDLVIAAGQDDLLAAMLGRGETVAGECALANGLAESRAIRATYVCAWDEVVLVLRHADVGTDGAVRTAEFAIEVERGTPPADLVDVLAARIRVREADFVWTAPVYENIEPPADRRARDE